jgi:hypothetical protein
MFGYPKLNWLGILGSELTEFLLHFAVRADNGLKHYLGARTTLRPLLTGFVTITHEALQNMFSFESEVAILVVHLLVTQMFNPQ